MICSKNFITNLLKKNKIFPKERFGQNFLVSRKALDKITNCIGSGELVIEIGAGLGVLTEKLAKRFKKIIALEIDREIFPLLQENLNKFSHIDFNLQDALQYRPPVRDYILCGNIPYNISSPLIRRFLFEVENIPQKIVFLVQKEFGEKICQKKNSLIKILITSFAQVKIRGNIKKNNFFPPPKIDSVVIEIIPHSNPCIPFAKWQNFFFLLEAGFGERRKLLVSNLAKNSTISKEEVQEIFLKLDIPPKARAEDLENEDWFALYNWMNNER